jgi:hypothetical protein
MTTERPQDKWLQPDTAAQLRTYTAQRMKGAWFRVIWSGALLLFFAYTLGDRLKYAQKNDATNGLIVFTILVLGRFSYYTYRLIKAHRDVAEMKRSLGVVA